mgnify:CR=1 FL=1
MGERRRRVEVAGEAGGAAEVGEGDGMKPPSPFLQLSIIKHQLAKHFNAYV